MLEIIKSRRCIRKYKRRKVEKEKLLSILEAGRWAPSGFNLQPWKFIVVQDSSTLRKIEEKVNRAIERLRLSMAKPFPATIQCLIVVVADPSSLTYEMESGMAVQNMMLQAVSQGLGSCILGSIRLAEKDIRELLHIPKRLKLICGVPVGYPDEFPEGKRKSLDEIVFYEKYEI
jgi:nitroreductase